MLANVVHSTLRLFYVPASTFHDNRMAKPILKWAGGKRQILPAIRGCLPPEEEAGRYHEPFFGGGALFFDTAPHHEGGSINDINPRLMNFYEQVRDNPDELIEILQSFSGPETDPDSSRDFSKTDRKDKEMRNYYYQQRELFNRRPNGESFDSTEEAALLLYLNRTCYNGLYRENQSGEFNVPIGRNQSNADWVQSQRIQKASHVLDPIDIFCGSFEYVENAVKSGDLVYFDPPYKPVSATSSFVEYSSEAFGQDEQKRLASLARRLHHEHGCHVVLSNSPPIRELYSGFDGFQVHNIGATRMINSNADDRGEVGEIIITTVPTDNRREYTPELDSFNGQEV